MSVASIRVPGTHDMPRIVTLAGGGGNWYEPEGTGNTGYGNLFVTGVDQAALDAALVAFEDELANPPPPPVPANITRTQGLLALLDRTPPVTEVDIEAVIAAIPDAGEQARASIRFRAATWERASPWVDTLGVALGLTATEIDDLFRAAALL